MSDDQNKNSRCSNCVFCTNSNCVGASDASALKKAWKNQNKNISFKQFIKEQLKSGNTAAETWVANKKGENLVKKLDKNVARIMMEKTASKLARKSKSSKKTQKPAETV